MLINISKYALDYSAVHNPELVTLLENAAIAPQITDVLNRTETEYEISPKSNERLTTIIVRSNERPEAKKKIDDHLKAQNIPHQDGIKSSNSIDLRSTDIKDWEGGNYRFMYKPGKGGLASAGSIITALGESFQAYACSARQKKGSDLEVVDEIFSYVDERKVEADRTLEECNRELTQGWLNSGLWTANAIANGYPSKGKYKFHRGSKLTQALETEFLRLAKNEGLAMNVNKWNPADIWLAHPSFKESAIKNFNSLAEYNQFLLEQFQKKRLIGVSLKIVRSAKVSEEFYNHDQSCAVNVKLKSISLGKDKFFSPKLTKSVVIHCTMNGKPMTFNFRSFTGGLTYWGGEINTKHAAGGKIGPAILDEMLQSYGLTGGLYYNAKDFKKFFQSDRSIEPPEHILLKYLEYYKILNKRERRKPEQMLPELRAQYKVLQSPWFYSKFLGMQVVGLMVKHKKIDQFMNEAIAYASSSTCHSSVFIKYS